MTDEEKLKDYPLVRAELEKQIERLRTVYMIISAAEYAGKESVPVKLIKEDVFPNL